MKKLNEVNSPLLNRKQVSFETEHFQKSTPKKRDLAKQIAAELKVAEEVINIKRITTPFGSTKSKIIADIYKTKEDLKKYAKIGKKEKSQEEAKNVAEKPAESPKEEPSQEIKVEEKKEA